MTRVWLFRRNCLSERVVATAHNGCDASSYVLLGVADLDRGPALLALKSFAHTLGDACPDSGEASPLLLIITVTEVGNVLT